MIQKFSMYPDTLSVPEFVQGYCAIVMANIPMMEETKAAIDHVGYLASVFCGCSSAVWVAAWGLRLSAYHGGSG